MDNRELLEYIFRGGGKQVVSTLPEGIHKQFDTKDVDAAWAYIVEQGKTSNVYINPNGRREDLPNGIRGSDDDVRKVIALAVDADVLGPAHKEQNLPPTKQDAIDTLNKLPIPPSVIVDSGYGIYGYYLFESPIDTTDEETRRRVAAIYKGFGKYVTRQVKISAYKLGATVLVSDELLEDAEIDLEEYVHSSMVETIGEREEEAFLVGNGKGKPTGIIYQAEVGTETEERGIISMDDAMDLTYSVKGPYRKNAIFVMSEEAYLSLRKYKHLNGRPAWSSNLADKEPETLFGYPVYVSKYLPDLTPGNTPILFGDFSYFWIGDRGKRNMKRLSERFADRGMIGFVMSQRVDAKLVLPEAVKTLKIKEA